MTDSPANPGPAETRSQALSRVIGAVVGGIILIMVVGAILQSETCKKWAADKVDQVTRPVILVEQGVEVDDDWWTPIDFVLPENGQVGVTVTVQQGGTVHVSVMPAAEWENFGKASISGVPALSAQNTRQHFAQTVLAKGQYRIAIKEASAKNLIGKDIARLSVRVEYSATGEEK